MARMLVLVLDRQEHLAEHGSVDGRKHPGNEVDSFERERIALLHGTTQNRLDTHEDVSRLLQEAAENAIALIIVRRKGGARLEAREVDRRHELAGEERPHGLPHDVG